MDQIQDLEEFDKNLISLFTLIKTIIKTHEKNNLNLSSRENPIMSRLERYIKIYDRTDPEEHIFYFQKIFDHNRSGILRGPDRDQWINSGNIIIHFGEETGNPVRNAKIHLSLIYKTSIKLRNDMEEALEGLPDVEQSKELLYPTLLLLHLYRIFRDISVSNEDKSRLTEYIRKLEKETGSKPTSKTTSSESGDTSLDGLMNMATGFMEQMGMKLPDGHQLPSGSELTAAFNGIIQNPQTKSFIGDMMKDMQQSNNIGDVVGKLINKLPSGMDSEVKQTIENNLNSLPDNNNNDSYDDDELSDEFIES